MKLNIAENSARGKFYLLNYFLLQYNLGRDEYWKNIAEMSNVTFSAIK